MFSRWIAGLLVLICMSCNNGIIPCPKVKTAKLHRSFKPSAAALTARATVQPEPETPAQRYVRTSDGHFVKNITMEDWDCPKPGAKRYMPKSVKDNIKKNRKKFEDDARTQADSVSFNR